MILRQTLLYLPAGLAAPVLQIVNVLVLTHWLSPAAVGLHALILAVQDLLHLAALIWWSQYLLRYLAPKGDVVRPGQDRSENVLIALGTFAQVIAAIVFVFAFAGPDATARLALAAAAATVTRSLVAHWSVRARSDHRPGLYGLAQIVAPLLSLALMLVAFTRWTPSLELAFGASALGHGVVACILWPLLGLARSLGRVDPEILRAAWRYGSYSLIGAILAWVSIQSVRFTNEALFGTAAVGLISVGWGIGQRVAQQLGVLATTAVFPLAVERTREAGLAAGLAQLSQGGTLLFAAVLPATAGIALLAAPLSQLLVSRDFVETTTIVLPLAALAGAARVMRHNYLDEVFQLAERPALMTVMDVVDALATVVLCLLGGLWFGLVGSVVGCVVASVATTVLATIVVRTTMGFSIDWRNFGKVAAATLAMSAALLLLPQSQGALAVGLMILLGGVVYAAVLFVLARTEIAHILRGRT